MSYKSLHYSAPLSSGFLTGAIKSRNDLVDTDFRSKNPNYWKEGVPKKTELVDRIGELAKKKGVSSAELVLAWVLGQGENVVAIPGTKKIKYLEQNLKGGEVVLSKEELAEVTKAANAADTEQ